MTYSDIVIELVRTYNEQEKVTKASVEVITRTTQDETSVSLYKKHYGYEKFLVHTVVTTGSVEEAHKELIKYIMYACTKTNMRSLKKLPESLEYPLKTY